MLHECARRLIRAPATLPIHFVQTIAPTNLICFTAVSIVTSSFGLLNLRLKILFLFLCLFLYIRKFKSSIGRMRYAYHLYTAVWKCVRTEFRTLSKADYCMIWMNFTCIGRIIDTLNKLFVDGKVTCFQYSTNGGLYFIIKCLISIFVWFDCAMVYIRVDDVWNAFQDIPLCHLIFNWAKIGSKSELFWIYIQLLQN